MGNHTHTMATLNPLHRFYFFESNFVVAIVVSDGSFYHWSPSLQTYQPILYQSPDSSTEFGANLYSWLDCKEISALLSPDEKNLILLCFCMPIYAPCRCPSWRFPCPLESKYETRVAAVEQSGPCRRHRSRGWPKESETPGLVWDHPNFQKFGKQRLQIESFGYILEAQTLGFAGVFFQYYI